MAQVARLIGGAGTGKTTELLRIMEMVLDTGRDPMDIGFCSFTRAARHVAATRAARQFGGSASELMTQGWFRTIHSICYRQAGSPKMVPSGRDGVKWMQEAVQADVSDAAATEEKQDLEHKGGSTDADIALAIWSAARLGREYVADRWAKVAASSDRMPPLDFVLDVIERYERAKWLEDRRDFTDLVADFVGVEFDTDGRSRKRTPLIDVPRVPVWFFDEQQDTSPLLDMACRRIARAEETEWVYVVGDPFQSIYGFAGAVHWMFLAWGADEERTMPKSWRCGRDVLELGERVLSETEGYFDRNIAPADHDSIVTDTTIEQAAEIAEPGADWLLLARTNRQARGITQLLDEQNKPWKPIQGNGKWTAPERNRGIQAITKLVGGERINAKEWKAVLKLVPSRDAGQTLLRRGTKSAESVPEWVTMDRIDEAGGTDEFVEFLRSGHWKRKVPQGQEFMAAAEQYGAEQCTKPTIRVGTIHSAKGEEAENVGLLTDLTQQVYRAATMSTEQMDEERRIRYVGITRASRRLYMCNGGSRYQI